MAVDHHHVYARGERIGAVGAAAADVIDIGAVIYAVYDDAAFAAILLVSAKTFKPYLAFYFPRTADTNTETGGLSMHKITQNSRVNTFTGHQ